MEENKHNIDIIAFIIFMIILWVGLGFLINFCFFHKKAVPETKGFYEERVYITPYGKRYHSENCSYIDEKYAISLISAEEKEYKACQHCGGTSFTVWVEGKPAQQEKNDYLSSFGLSAIIIYLIVFYRFFNFDIEKIC